MIYSRCGRYPRMEDGGPRVAAAAAVDHRYQPERDVLALVQPREGERHPADLIHPIRVIQAEEVDVRLDPRPVRKLEPQRVVRGRRPVKFTQLPLELVLREVQPVAQGRSLKISEVGARD